jgi:hypothetical protein
MVAILPPSLSKISKNQQNKIEKPASQLAIIPSSRFLPLACPLHLLVAILPIPSHPQCAHAPVESPCHTFQNKLTSMDIEWLALLGRAGGGE